MQTTIPQSWREHDRKIRPYVWTNRLISFGEGLVGLALVAVFIFGPLGRELDERLAALWVSGWLRTLAFFGLVALTWEALSFPFSLCGYHVEKRFGLSRQNLASWLVDQIKGVFLKLVLGAIALSLVRLTVATCGQWWWLACATLFFLFSIGLAQLAPVLLIPIFFKMKPMADGPLKQRLLGLCRQFQIQVSEVYHLGLGEKTEKGNAAFMGLGRTKRIVIGDTLYEKYAPEEVEAVFAHELGHQVHHDLWKGIGLSTGLLYLSFFAASWLAAAYAYPPLGTSVQSPYGLLVFFALFSLIQMPLGVLQAGYSRARERAADGFALNKVGLAASLADALEKLTIQNYGLFRPNPILEFLFASHPAPWRRITRMRSVTK
jgi:STE24 endopeptidase